MQFQGLELPLLFNLSLFDFTANELSRSLEPFVKSTTEFSKRFEDAIKGKGKDILVVSGDDIEIPQLVAPGTETPASDTQSCNGTALNISQNKRVSSCSPPEVEPTPAFVKKLKQDVSVKESSDSEFQKVIREKYLIREGKR